jgi:tRNA pseudouridine38-40 synthase
MHGVRLTAAYDGAGFAGFAAQPGQRTVQGALNDAATSVSGHPVLVRGCSRTDSGVHAEGQVIAFATARELPPERWVAALNSKLPEDVAVRDGVPCAPDYEPRFDALDKTYRYLFHVSQVRSPLWRGRAFHLGRLLRGGRSLDLDAMQRAAALLQGTHDFKSFRAAADVRENTVRTLSSLTLERGYWGDPTLWALEVCGTAFMLNMVRILAGTLVDVGRGQLTVDDVAALVRGEGSRADAGLTAPAHGLTLLRVTLGRASAPASPPAP